MIYIYIYFDELNICILNAGKKFRDESSSGPTPVEDVIVISLGNDIECPGMLSEQKVLSWEQENKRRKVTYNEEMVNYVASVEPGEKRTRFSLSHDQESIGMD